MIAQILLYLFLFIWVLPLILPDKHWTRYYACYLTFYLYNGIGIPLFVLFYTIFPRRWNRILTVVVSSFFFKYIGIELELRNGDSLKKQGKVVVVANHQSAFDTMGIFSSMMNFGECLPVVKQEFKNFPPLIWLGYYCGMICIDRSNSASAIQLLNTVADHHFQQHDDSQILIFPEGTRNREKSKGALLPFKKGAFKLAFDRGIPIFPIVFSPYYFIQNKSFRRGKLIISFLEPISSTDVDSVEQLMEKTRTIMEDEFNKLTIEVTGKSDVNK